MTARVASIHAHYSRYFPAYGSTNLDFFKPKTFSIPREIIPQNFRSLGFAISEEIGNIQIDSLTHSRTDWFFDREIDQTLAFITLDALVSTLISYLSQFFITNLLIKQ